MDSLLQNEEDSQWLQSFFEKRPSAGFVSASSDPVDFAVRASANHHARTKAMGQWVSAHLDRIAKTQQLGPTDTREEALLEGLYEWCFRRPHPELYGPRLLSLLSISEPDVENGWTSNLGRAFKHALIKNQVDDSLENLWSDLLDNSKPEHGFTRYWPDDFEGLLHMPGSKGERFAWSAIARSLKTIYGTLLPQNTKSLSPTGPMRDLYRRIGGIADLDEPELSLKLWKLAAEAKWTYEQEQTVPRQFFALHDGNWVIPRVADDKMLRWRKLSTSELGVSSIVMISKKDRNCLVDAEVQVINRYESGRVNSPRNFRPEMFYECMGSFIPAEERKKVLAKKSKQRRIPPNELYRQNGSSLFALKNARADGLVGV